MNSGNRSKAANDQETNALEVNLRAADEIARQLRLRDMGGIIVVDFIDMAKGEHRQQLYEHMREIMANDRARHNILPLSKFGLMQITRQRVRPALDITTAEKCPSCFGKGEVQPSLLFTDTLYEKLEYLVNTLGVKGFIMYVHPFVDAYIKRGLFTSLYGRWRRSLGRCFKILPDQSLAYLQYRVLDKDRNEIDLKEEKDMDASSAEKRSTKAKKRGGDDDADNNAQSPAQATKEGDDANAPAAEKAKSKRRKRKKKPAEATDAAAGTESAVPEAATATGAEDATPAPAATTPETPAKVETADKAPKPQRPPRQPRPRAKTSTPEAAADNMLPALPPPPRSEEE